MTETALGASVEATYATVANPRLGLLIPLVVACAFFMENLDSSIIATSIPQIAHSLGVGPLQLNVAITSYLLSLAVFIPISGWMADRFGTRTVFCAAIVLFTLGSALCGFSQNLWQLVLTRILQGVGGAMTTPVGRLMLLKSFPKSRLVTAMSYVTVPALVGPALGPLLGGLITTYASWRWIFYINIPIGMLGILLAARYFENYRSATPRRFDFLGFTLCGIGLAAVELCLDYAGRDVLPFWVEATILALGIAVLGLYALHARRHPDPAIDLRLFGIKTFRLAVLAGGLGRMGFASTPFLLPLLFQIAFGRTPLESGSLTFVIAIGSMCLKTAAPRIVRYCGFRTILVGNGIVVGLTTMSLAFLRPDTPYLAILGLLLVFGFLRSLQFTCMNALSYADLTGATLSKGTSIGSVGQQLSQSFGVAIGAMLLSAFVGSSGTVMTIGDFEVVFVLVGLLPIVSALCFLRLGSEDGAATSGHQARTGRRSAAQASDARKSPPSSSSPPATNSGGYAPDLAKANEKP
ncbi:MAG TPA: DHA2 family efflux MFS transporter permease subunit [Stellaceae bacterium]|nr:DHA2 family efflux MFS transporter permease subunit [Stellaceae bacterium]